MKTIKTNATLTASTRTVKTNIERFNVKNLYAIINQTADVVIYATGTTGKGYTSVTGDSIVLDYDTTTMNNADVIQVIYEDGITENGAVSVGNGVVKFRDGFALGFDTNIWDEFWVSQGTSVRFLGGNATGASYLGVSLSPYAADSEYILTSKQAFKMPIRFGYGVSISQRILGEEIEMSLVGCDVNGNVEVNTTVAPLAISGTISVTSNVATINFATNHNLRGNDRIVLYGNTDSRMNVGPVVVTVVTPTQITIPLTIANASYTAGGFVTLADIFDYVKNAVGLVHENTTATNASFALRRNGGAYFSSLQNIATTVATQNNTSPYTEAFRSAGDTELISSMEQAKLVSRTASSTAAATTIAKYTESLPDEDKLYKLRLRVRALPNRTVLGASITAIAKTGTTTATVTTATNHGLTTSDFVQIYGVRDITNFPNLTVATQVASIVSPTQFTIVIGAAVTASSAGGVVARVQGGVLVPGALNFSLQSIVVTNNTLTATLNTTSSGLLPGETVELAGLDGAASSYNGAYIVRRLTGSTVELQAIGGGTIATIVSTNCGGAIVKRTDVRLHYIRGLEYTRHLVELSNNRGGNDGSEGIPAFINNTVTVAGTVVSNIGTGTMAGLTFANLNFPQTVADVASAALTTTTTTAAVTPTFGTAYEVNIPVTVVTGTNQTLDVVVQESDDAGTNWYDVYHFPRITATGIYRSPILTMKGNRVRYVQTVNGTSPSFTRAINRLQSSITPTVVNGQVIDRAVSLTTLNAGTTNLVSDGAKNAQLVINIGTATTPPALQLEGSDDNGATWYSIGSPLPAVPSSTVQLTVSNINAGRLRARVSTAGATVVAGYVLVKCY